MVGLIELLQIPSKNTLKGGGNCLINIVMKYYKIVAAKLWPAIILNVENCSLMLAT
jgi:hypothetical protein